MFRCELADPLSLLQRRELWDELAGVCAFRKTAWLHTWWHHFGKHDAAYFVVARNSLNQICGILPLYRQAGNKAVLRLVGDGQSCSDGLSILCADRDATAVGQALGEWLAKRSADDEDGWTVMELEGVLAGDVAMTALEQGLKAEGATVHIQSRMHSWYLSTRVSWEEYLASLSKPSRRPIKKAADRLDQDKRLAVRVSGTWSDAESVLRTMMLLHQQRWNEAGQAGSFACPAFQDFIVDVAQRHFQDETLRMHSLWYDDEMIAGELQFLTTDETIVVYSTGMSLLHQHLQPGRTLAVATIRYAIKNQLRGIDYLRGDEPYKAQLRATPTRVANLRAVAQTTRAKLQHVAWKGAFELTQLARRCKGSEPIVVLPSLQTPANYNFFPLT